MQVTPTQILKAAEWLFWGFFMGSVLAWAAIAIAGSYVLRSGNRLSLLGTVVTAGFVAFLLIAFFVLLRR